MAKARLRRGIEIVKLANRIEALKMQEDDLEESPNEADVPANAKAEATEAIQHGASDGPSQPPTSPGIGGKKSLGKLAKAAIFREVVLAKVRDIKEEELAAEVEKNAHDKANTRNSYQAER